jgi:hypothetical protein
VPLPTLRLCEKLRSVRKSNLIQRDQNNKERIVIDHLAEEELAELKKSGKPVTGYLAE